MSKVIKMPTYDELINPCFLAMKSLGGSGTNDEILDRVILDLNVDESILDTMQPNTNQTQFSYRLAWARTYLKKYGVIDNVSRGLWVLNSKYKSIDQIDVPRLLNSIKRINSSRPNGKEVDQIQNNDNEYADDHSQEWKKKLFELLKNMDPFKFEEFSQLFLRRCGFDPVNVTKRTGDGGIDGTGHFKMNGIISMKIAFQCKKYNNTQIGAKDIRDFRGSLSSDVKYGLFITTSVFTTAAKQEASADGKMHIDLLDGNDLIDKIVELELGLKPITTYIVDEDFYKKYYK